MSNLKLNASDVWSWLLKNDLVEPSANRWILTGKFHDLVDKEEKAEALPVPAKSVSLLPTKKEDWERLFMNFIMEAQVPARGEASDGTPYYLNRFSEDGLKVFKRALENGVVYEVLVRSTLLYYKSSTKLKKGIGNYFKQGDWRTDYEALLQSADQGIEALQSHIKQEVSSNVNRTQYKIG